MRLKKITEFQNALLGWYKTSARNLPWRCSSRRRRRRSTKDPYKIWVSEIMLQQTQVDTVIPYYEKWLKRFPTIQSLAKAPLSDVLKYWAGLGYYRRARMLHEAARKIIKEFDGKFPKTAAELMRLPGIGRYTAGAVASIAFGEKTPVLDGNVIRVLTRIEAVKADIGSPATIAHLWKTADGLVPAKNPGDFNQAMMELGATVCFPENPRCAVCPVSKFCAGRRLGRETDFPVRQRREKITKIKNAALILRNNGKVLIQKQPSEGRWGGLWMFPHWKSKKLMRKDIGNITIQHHMTIRHGFTKYRVELAVYEHKLEKIFPLSGGSLKSTQPMEWAAAEASRSEAHSNQSPIRGPSGPAGQMEIFSIGDCFKWVRTRDLAKFAFPSPHQKIVRELVENHG